jgi:hypothetical protein
MTQVSEEFRQAFIEGLMGKPAPEPTTDLEKRIFESINRFVDNNHDFINQWLKGETCSRNS